jgi:Lecithin retinol acyltransferase
MSEQFSTCAVRLPSFGHVWATRRPAPELGRHWPFRAASAGETQHVDTLLAAGAEPQPGSHVVSPRPGYMHHGIYVGAGSVVHYAGLARGSFRGRIEEVSLAEFAHGRSVWTRSSKPSAFAPREVICRARSRVGECRYRVLRNNCEHFCEWCLRGEPRSYQVERFLSFRPAFGVMLGVISRATANRSPPARPRRRDHGAGWQAI